VVPDGTFGRYKVEVEELRGGSQDGGALPGGMDYLDGSHVAISYSSLDICPHALARRNVVFAYYTVPRIVKERRPNNRCSPTQVHGCLAYGPVL